MNSIISKSTKITYQGVIKPLFFKQKPDSTHQYILHLGKFSQRIFGVKGTLHSIWAYDNQSVLGQTLRGITFRNPVGLSAGFDKNFELPPIMKSIGFGFMEGGSLTYQPCAGNPKPWFHRLPNSKSLVVNVGLANQGVTAIIKRLERFPRELFRDFPLNISVAKTNSPEASTDKDAIADYVGSLKAIGTAGVGDMITLNISCPNAYGGEPFTTPTRLDRLLTQVDAIKLVQPVFVKMPSDLNWEAFDELLAVIARHRITGVTISNLAKDRNQLKLKDSLPDGVRGNLSGKPTWELSNKLIRQTYRKYNRRFVIIGVGGIFSAEDAYTKIRYGANLVELVTGLIFEGPQLIGRVNHGLVDLLHRDGFSNVAEAVGVDA
jgi:dihydroorotate dehydrogenase (fumarate)